MRKFFVIVVFVCSGLFAKAQFIDSLQNIITRKGTFTFSFTSRNSFITNYSAYISGFSIGVTFGKKLNIGGGYNFLSSDLTKKISIGSDVITEQLSFSYFSYYVQYIMSLSRHWKLYIMPICVGIGGSSYNYFYKFSYHVVNSYTVMPYEPQVELDYNFNKWLGLYTQVGYRFMLVNNPTIIENFNSPIYSFGVILSPFELFAAIFPRTKLAHMIEDN
jgi:hypothetical protein